MADYRRGQPSIQPGSQQLPYGGASQANAMLPSPDSIPVSYANAKDEPPETPDLSLSENEQILLQPPNPNYPQMPPRQRPGRVPRYVVRHLPALMAAAKDEDAPETVRALYKGIVSALEREMSGL